MTSQDRPRVLLPDPEFRWYAERSQSLKLPPRCPIASVHLCPRYYLSLSLLGDIGLITSIEESENARLYEQAKNSSSFPVIAEEQPSVTFTDDKWSLISRFCPEVTYDTLGVFASTVARYADEIDRDAAQAILRQEGTPRSDWRWQYSDVIYKHYTECKEFSVYTGSDIIAGTQASRRRTRPPISPEVRWTVLARDKFTCQYCGRKPPDVQLELDHRLPKSKGGKDTPTNLVTACMDCNRGKGDRELIQE